MNELGFPKEHWVLLVLLCLFDLGCIDLLCLLLLDLVNLSEGSASEFLLYDKSAF